MYESSTWRDFLGMIIVDVKEKHRIADALGVNPITLTRWVSGKSDPRPQVLRLMLDALPNYRQELTKLLEDEFPQLTEDITTSLSPTQKEEISASFYAKVLSKYTQSLPSRRISVISLLILQQMLAQLDPSQQGMCVKIAMCVPPDKGMEVRSLRKFSSLATPPLVNNIETNILFMGAESLAGYAVASGRLVVIQEIHESERAFTAQPDINVNGIVASPILQGDRIAGCLLVESTQTSYFSPVKLSLISQFSELLVLAFELTDFYPLDKIDLHLMPDHRQQQPITATFRQRVVAYRMKVQKEGKSLTIEEAERNILKNLEEELLQIAA